MKILVTGATGFVGSSFLNYVKENNLFENDEIILLSSREVEGYKCILHKNYTFTKEDFIEYGIDKIDILIHIGAFSPKIKSDMNNIEKNSENIFNTNYLLKNLVPITKKFVYVSSISVYNLNAQLPLSEETSTVPNDIYGFSKLYCEKMIQEYCKQKDLTCNIARLGVVYGNNSAYMGFIPTVIKDVLSGISPKVYNGGDEIRNFIHVKDCCRVIAKSATINMQSDIVNVVSSQNLKVKDIVNKIIEISKKDLAIINVEIPNNLPDVIFNNKHLTEFYGENIFNMDEGLEAAYSCFCKNEELVKC